MTMEEIKKLSVEQVKELLDCETIEQFADFTKKIGKILSKEALQAEFNEFKNSIQSLDDSELNFAAGKRPPIDPSGNPSCMLKGM